MTADIYLNGATLMTTPTQRVVTAARDAGYAGIEARAERLLADTAEVRAAAELVRAGEVWSLNGLRLTLKSGGAMDRDAIEADIGPRLRLCGDLRCSNLLAVPPRGDGVDAARAIAGVRDALQLARDRAAQAGVKVSFEYLGFTDCPINTSLRAAEAVDGIEGVGLVLDSCHWHASGARSLDGFPVERLAMVHLNDAPAKPPHEIEDADRLLPGEGVIHLSELTLELRRRGYRGPWSLETFNPALWREDPTEIARRGFSAVRRAVDA